MRESTKIVLAIFLLVCGCRFTDHRLRGTLSSSSDLSTLSSQPQLLKMTLPISGNFMAGQNLDFNFEIDTDVLVTGQPRLPLEISGTTYYADYISGSGSNTLTYRLQLDCSVPNDLDGIAISSQLEMNSGSIKSLSGTDFRNDFTAPPEAHVTVNHGNNSPVISVFDSSAPEGSPLAFTIKLSEPNCGGMTSIEFGTTDDTALAADLDYLPKTGTLIIPPGQLHSSILVTTVSDTVLEQSERIQVSLTSTSVGSLGDSNALGYIGNNDSGNFTWIGIAKDKDWFNPLNWQGGNVPDTNTEMAFFSSGSCSGSNCDVNISENVSLRGVDIGSGFTGNIVQMPGVTIDIGDGNWTQVGGRFQGGDSGINIQSGDFFLGDGIFVSTSGDLSIGRFLGGPGCGLTSNPHGFRSTPGSFEHNFGRVIFDGSIANDCGTEKAIATLGINGTIKFHVLQMNVRDTSGGNGFNDAFLQFTKTDVVTVEHELILTDGWLSDANIQLSGDLTAECVNPSVGECLDRHSRTTSVTFVGSQPQFYTTQSNSLMPKIIVNSQSSLSPTFGVSFAQFMAIEIKNGTFNAPVSGTVAIGHFLGGPGCGIADVLDGLVVSGGTYNAIGSELLFNGSIAADCGGQKIVNQINVPPGFSIDSLKIDIRDTSASQGWNGAALKVVSGSSLIVNGDLTFNDGTLLGEINAKGNLILTCSDLNTGECAEGGDGAIRLSGGVNQEYTAPAEAEAPTIIVDTSQMVLPSVGTTDISMWRFVLENGTFRAPSGKMHLGFMGGQFCVPSNTGGFTVTGGIFDPGPTGTLVFDGGLGIDCGTRDVSVVNLAGPVSLNNLEIAVNDYLPSGGRNGANLEMNGGTFIISGKLTMTDGQVNNGILNIHGDVSINCLHGDATTGDICSGGGTAQINLVGTSPTSWSQDFGGLIPGSTLVIDKTSASLPVLLQTDLDLLNGNQNLNLKSGRIEVGSKFLRVNENANIDSRGDITCTTGKWFRGTSVTGAGVPTLSCPSSSPTVG